MLSHLRTEAYPVYERQAYGPRLNPGAPLSYEENVVRIAEAKRAFEAQREGV